MALSNDNKWVGYITRTYQQIKERVLNTLQNFVPEITDHTDTNIFVRMISVWSGIAEMLNYYIDNSAREAYPSQVRLYSNMVLLTQTFDYQISLNSPASLNIVFEIENTVIADTIIPQGTIVSGTDFDFTFATSQTLIIPAGSLSGEVGASQTINIFNTSIGISDGSINQSFTIIDNKIAYEGISVRVDGVTWEEQFTLAYSKYDDLHFVVTLDEDSNIIILFGDAINGKIPDNASNIEIDYKSTEGVLGNEVYVNSITDIDSSVTLPSGVGNLTCYNSIEASGGGGIETLEQLRYRIPRSIRTLRRAVTRQDYIDIAELYPGVLKAALLFECGNPIYLFIVPLGGGQASVSLLNAVDTWFEDKKIITMFITSKPTGKMKVSLEVDVTAQKGYQNSIIQSSVIETLTNFLSWENQDIKSSVFVSDLYQEIEAIDGVKNSNITKINIIPFPRILQGSNELIFTIVLNDNNLQSDRWTVKMLSALMYQLYKNDLYVNNYNVGDTVTTDEAEFIITGSYFVGDTCIFKTYSNMLATGKIDLEEYSVPIAELITVSVTGGI